MSEIFIPVHGGGRLFVDVRGRADAPVLAYIHGGPGMGCWDFMRVQGDRLAEHFRVVGIDQRGVLRSDALAPDATVDVATVADDLEAVRRALDVDSWLLLGHSAGACYALDFAIRFPAVVTGVIFDSPGFDIDATDRYRLPVAARIHDALGNTEQARRCRRAAVSPGRLTAGDGIVAAAAGLGERFDELFFRNPVVMAEYQRSRAGAGFTDAQWAKGAGHRPIIDELYAASWLPALSRLTVPSMVLKGSHDLVASPDQIDVYRATVGGAVVTLPESGHFGQLEAPEEYAAAVIDFARSLARSAAGPGVNGPQP